MNNDKNNLLYKTANFIKIYYIINGLSYKEKYVRHKGNTLLWYIKRYRCKKGVEFKI